MSGGVDVLSTAMAAAAQPGPKLAPDALLAATAAHEFPLMAMNRMDAANEMFAAIRDQFGFVDYIRATGARPSSEDFDRLVALLRWLIRECREWKPDADPNRRRLAVILIAGHFAEMGGNFWEAMPTHTPPSDGLLAAMAALIAGMQASISTRGLAAPIWETEAVQKFLDADAAGDWGGIAEGWRQIEHSCFPLVSVTQSVRCLARFDFDGLVRAVAGLRQTVPIMSIVRSLSGDAAMRVAAGSDNAHVQFAATLDAAASRPGVPTLGDTGRELLAEVLVKVSADQARWAKWMKVFNFAPVRFPAIQGPLGRALAATDDAASQAYWNALILYETDRDGRQAVAECLRVFRADASPDRRHAVWKQAHTRWAAWRFAAGDSNVRLTEPGHCQMDYAIVGYAVECLSEEERQARIRELAAQLQTCTDIWHADVTACLSEWNRLLSLFQPFAHADATVRSGGDWLADRQYFPFDPATERYAARKFRMRQTSVQAVD